MVQFPIIGDTFVSCIVCTLSIYAVQHLQSTFTQKECTCVASAVIKITGLIQLKYIHAVQTFWWIGRKLPGIMLKLREIDFFTGGYLGRFLHSSYKKQINAAEEKLARNFIHNFMLKQTLSNKNKCWFIPHFGQKFGQSFLLVIHNWMCKLFTFLKRIFKTPRHMGKWALGMGNHIFHWGRGALLFQLVVVDPL